jgi:hypothetical protein
MTRACVICGGFAHERAIVSRQKSRSSSKLRCTIERRVKKSWRGTALARLSASVKTAFHASIVFALLLLAACDQPAASELPRPTTPPSKVESFNGTLQPQGRLSYSFTVSQDGYVEATLVGLGADPSTKVGLGIGTPSVVGECDATYSVTTAAGPSAQIVGTGLAGRLLCVTIYDVGNLTAPTLFTITVASS